MTIVIPYKYNENNTELKFTLRSIEKYLTGWSEIVIIGDQPPPKISDYCFTYFTPSTIKKQVNIKEKLIYAFYLIPEDIIYWADDIYLLKRLKVQDFRFWYEKSLGQAAHEQVGYYKKVIENTIALVGEEAPCFDCHHPMILNKLMFLNHMGYWGNKEYAIKSLYANRAKTYPFEKITEAKIFNDKTYEEIKQVIEGKLFFSTKNHVINGPMMKVFNELFPDKSKFEI